MSTDWDERTAAAYADEEHYGERPEDLPLPPPQRMRRVIVVGSGRWDQDLIVQAVLLRWWHEHGQPPVLLITGMGAAGAEEQARQWGSANGWTVMSQTDAQLLRDSDTADVAFAFVRDTSDVASLVNAISARRAIRMFSDDTLEPVGSWLSR